MYNVIRVNLHEVDSFIKNKKYFNGLYVMGMVDYLCRLHDLPLYEGYDLYRNKILLKNTAYPSSYYFLSDESKKNERKDIENLLFQLQDQPSMN